MAMTVAVKFIPLGSSRFIVERERLWKAGVFVSETRRSVQHGL